MQFIHDLEEVMVFLHHLDKRVYASIETHKSDCYYVTYDFYVNGYGYIKWGGLL